MSQLCFSPSSRRFAALPSFVSKTKHAMGPQNLHVYRGFYGYIYNLVFQVAFHSNRYFFNGFFGSFFHGFFVPYFVKLRLQEVRWTFVGLLHFSVRLHRTCSIGEYRPRLGHCRIKAEVFKLIYGFLDFFLKRKP